MGPPLLRLLLSVPWGPLMSVFSCSCCLELVGVCRNHSYNDFRICSTHAFIHDGIFCSGWRHEGDDSCPSVGDCHLMVCVPVCLVFCPECHTGDSLSPIPRCVPGTVLGASHFSVSSQNLRHHPVNRVSICSLQVRISLFPERSCFGKVV